MESGNQAKERIVDIPRRSIQRIFVTRDVFSDDSNVVTSFLEGECGLKACYAGTAAGKEMSDGGV